MTAPLAFIIEDDPKLGAIYDTVVRQAGYDTELIQAGDVAVARLAVATPDLILLDIHLPYVSGLDILQQVRASDRLARVPVIVLTADIYIAKSLEEQAEHVLVKSLGVSRLRALVAQLQPGDGSAQANRDGDSADNS